MESEKRAIFRQMLSDVKTKLDALPVSSYIRSALPQQRIEQIFRRIENESIGNLDYGYWPPLFCLLAGCSIDQIKALEEDIQLVAKHSTDQKRNDVVKFLETDATSDRQWVAGRFETFVKSRLLRRSGPDAVSFNHHLLNGRNVDIRLEMDSKAISLECTVITDSDDARVVWDKFLEESKVDPSVALIRPGEFDSPNAKGPSRYYDCLRFYAKVYDKLAKDLNPKKFQFSEDGPNVLLVSFFSHLEPLSALSTGIGWALDELLSARPKQGALRTDPNGIRDISLTAWMNFTAKQLIREKKLEPHIYQQDFSDLIRAPRKLGGILLFDSFSLKATRVNYYARAPLRLTHREIADIEDLFDAEPV